MSQHRAPSELPNSRNIALAKSGADKFKADESFTATDGLPMGPGATENLTARTAARPQMFDGSAVAPATEGRLPFAKK